MNTYVSGTVSEVVTENNICTGGLLVGNELLSHFATRKMVFAHTIRGDSHLKGPFAWKRPFSFTNIQVIGVYLKGNMWAFIWCMVAYSLPTNDWVSSQNVGGSWWSQAQLKQKQEGKQQDCSDEKTRVSCTYLYAIWSCVRVDQATIPHLKEDNRAHDISKNGIGHRSSDLFFGQRA